MQFLPPLDFFIVLIFRLVNTTEVVFIIDNIKLIKKNNLIPYFLYKWVPALSSRISMNA